MKCEEARGLLRRHFDEGARLSEGVEPHLADCASCRSYCDRLASLNGVLTHMPLERPAPGLNSRIKARLAAGEASEAWAPPPWAGAIAATMLAATAVAIGFFFPVAVDLRAWWDIVDSRLPRLEPGQMGAFVYSGMEAVWAPVPPYIERGMGLFPSPALWVSLVLVATLLLVFNAFEAAGLRSGLAGCRRDVQGPGSQ